MHVYKSLAGVTMEAAHCCTRRRSKLNGKKARYRVPEPRAICALVRIVTYFLIFAQWTLHARAKPPQTLYFTNLNPLMQPDMNGLNGIRNEMRASERTKGTRRTPHRHNVPLEIKILRGTFQIEQMKKFLFICNFVLINRSNFKIIEHSNF